MSGIMTNKLNIQFDYGQIIERFLVYQFSTSQKYIKFNAKIFDEKLMALSIVHESGKKFYALYAKNEINQSSIAEQLHKTEEGKDYSIDQVDIKTVPQNLLLQLFLNAIPNPQDNFFTFNNITGKLYCINADNLHVSKSGIIHELQALEIRANNRLELELNVKTFTSLALKNKIVFKNTKLMDYPRYKLFNGKLVRIISEEVELKDTYILRKATNKKNTADFINFVDYKTFLLSKCGILYELLNQLKNRFDCLVVVEFERITDANELRFNMDLCIEKNEKINSFIERNEFAIVDTITDAYSKMYVEKFISAVKTVLPDIKISQAKKVQMDKQCFVLVHNKEYYDGAEDPYTKTRGRNVQHITFEDFNSDKDAGIENIIKELYIKNDLIGSKITIIDWAKFNFDKPWAFGVKADDKFVFMEIQADGSFAFRNIELDLFGLDEYQQYVKVYEDACAVREVEGIVIDGDKNIAVLYRSKKFTLPEFFEIGQELFNANKKLIIPKNKLIEYLERIDGDKISVVKRYIAEIVTFYSAEFSREQIIRIVTDRSIRKKLSDIIEFETSIPLKTYLRGGDKKYKTFSSNMNLHYYQSGNITNYFVGEKTQGIKLSFSRASLIREIDGMIDINKMMPLLMVDFVRNEQLTVIPFPFKYLREYLLTVMHK